MRSTYKQLYYINRSKVKSDGTTSIMCRITIDGKAVVLSTGLYCQPEEWNSKKGAAAALPFLEEIDEPSQSNPDGFASSPEGRALCAVRQSRSSSGEALAFRRQKKSSPLGGAGTAQAVTERVWT